MWKKKKVMHQFIELKMTWKCKIAPSARTTKADKFSLFKKKKNWFIPTYRKNVTVKTDYMLLVAFYTAPIQHVDPPVISYWFCFSPPMFEAKPHAWKWTCQNWQKSCIHYEIVSRLWWKFWHLNSKVFSCCWRIMRSRMAALWLAASLKNSKDPKCHWHPWKNKCKNVTRKACSRKSFGLMICT